MAGQLYGKEEVNAILARAIEHDNKRGELSHDDLMAAAEEVGISPEALEKAAAEVMTERTERAELVAIQRERWRGFIAHLIPYVMANGLLVTINVLTTHFPWAVIPALGWGIGLVSHLWAVIHPNPEQHRLERRLYHKRVLDECGRVRVPSSAVPALSGENDVAHPAWDASSRDETRRSTK